MRRLLLAWLFTVPVALLAGSGAAAQLYKWTDERGVVNYSDKPPVDLRAANKLATVEDRVSVYTPDQALTQAIASRRQQGNEALSERIGYLERELEVERRARQYAAAAVAQPAPCPAGIDCYGISSVPVSYIPVSAPVRKRFISQAQLRPGTIAGTAVGMNGYIPGNSASAPSAVQRHARPSRPEPTHLGVHTR